MAAYECFQPLANDGNVRAQLRAGTMLYYGQGVPRNQTEAVKLLQTAADAGETDAQFLLGLIHFQGGIAGVSKKTDDIMTGKKELTGEDIQKIGQLSQTDESYKKSFEWFAKAAQKGSATAQYNIAMMYAEGKGVEKSNVQALIWMTKAAGIGSAKAMETLARAYEFGHYGLTPDFKQAKMWYEKLNNKR
jgi:TPR repeat protein